MSQRAKITIPYKPRYPEVHELLRERRFVVLAAHRRFGKTVLAVNHLIREACRCERVGGHFGYVAPFRNQAKAVAWDYLKHFTRPIPRVTINESELSIALPSPGGGAKARLFGADNPNSLRGMYFDGIVLDEVAQMKPEVWEEIIQPALADRGGSALFIGTPQGINLFSRLYYFAAAEEAAGSRLWASRIYPVQETCALNEEEVERLRRELSPAKFRQEMECDFSASSDDVLITLDEVSQAMARQADPDTASRWPLVLGVDIARFGSDATVFFPRRGPCALAPLILNKLSNTEVARRLIAWIAEHKPVMVNIDQGQGTGVIDMVRDLCPTTPINEIPFGSKATDDKRYFNKRAEMWFELREWIRRGGSLPAGASYHDALMAELTCPRYSFDSSSRAKLEAKEEIFKRLHHSTDLGDALALTFALPVQVDDARLFGRQAQAARSILHPATRKFYDPFRRR